MTEFATIELTLIASSLTNPRKHFNPAKLAELAESIKTSGVHQPILVRPLPGSRVADTDRKVEFELVCGERRLRASQQAGVHAIPAMIRGLTDEQVLEIQIVENLQRDDLTELEEAEGYEQMMQHASITADQVGEKIGKSRSYVYGRLKLLDLSMECKQALREGKIDASRALLIARIPDSTLQTKALAEAMREDFRGDIPSVRALQSWLQANVMLRLDKASFKITDARLVQSAGSCKDCPKRTGANPDLFLDVSSADICIDPACFHSKEEAHRNALRKKAESNGMRIVEGAEAEELIAHQYTNHIDGYSHLGQVRNDIAAIDGTTGHTLRDLLGADAPAPILFEHPFTKELIEAVPTDEAEGVLLAKGLLKATIDAKQNGKMAKPEDEFKRLQNLAEKDTNKAVRTAQFAAAVQAIRTTSDAAAYRLLSPAFIRAWLVLMLDVSVHVGYMAKALGYTFQDDEVKEDGLVMHIKACSGADLYRAAAIVMMEEDEYSPYSDQEPTVLNAAMDAMGIDAKELAKAATATVRGEYAARLKAVKAEITAQKPDLPQPPLAQPKNATGKDSKGSKGKSKTPAAPANKLSEGEALSGIAAAMQGLEGSASAPEGAVAPSDLPACGFDVGQKVKVVTDLDKLGMFVKKMAGKEGTITKKEPGSNHWHVKVRSGGLQMFAEDQIERVAA